MQTAEKRALELTRAQWRTLFVVWITYGAFYLCRVNIGPARADVQKGLGIDPLEMGLILGALKIGYAIGQLVNGQLAERFGARRILNTGMYGSVIACLLFASARPVADALGGALPPIAGVVSRVARIVSPDAALQPIAALLVLVWFMNGFFQAGGWPPTVKVMSRWYTPTQRGRMMGVIGTSYQLGSALTIALSGALISASGGDYRAAFAIPAVLLSIVGVHAWFRLRETPDEGEAPGVVPPVKEKAPLAETLWLTLTNYRIWILAAALFGLDIVRYGFLDWAPGHLKTVHGSGTLLSALKVAVFPLAGAVGALLSGWITDRFFQSRRAPMIAVSLGIVGVLTLAYERFVPLGVAPTVACLVGIGFFIYAAQILIVGTAAQDFARKGKTAGAAGFIDFMGYMGAFAGDVVTGWFLKNKNFEGAIRFWAIAALVSAVLAATLWAHRPRPTEA